MSKEATVSTVRALVSFGLVALFAAATAPAQVTIPYFDDFEAGVGNWSTWPEADEQLLWDDAHSSSPTHSARAHEADPWGYASYADFSPQAGAVYTEVLVWDDFDDDGTNYDRPVSNMIALIGESTVPEDYTDWLELGVCAWCDPNGLTEKYYIRTSVLDAQNPPINCLDTGVYRDRGWIKLAIWADAWADGGEVRFYINDQLVGTSHRATLFGYEVGLQYVRLGLNFKSYDPMWYDNAQILTAPPCGVTPDVPVDIDVDGDVDLSDYGKFLDCYNGPAQPYPPIVGCECLDSDYDGDVDLTDYGKFLDCYNGPNRPPNC
jgi:hypothetical protein